MSRYSSTLLSIRAEFATLDCQSAHKRISTEIEDVRTLLHSLLALRNSLSVVCKLPDEIWIHVGRLLYRSAEQRWAAHDEISEETLTNVFLPLTQACQYFRNLFATMPEFWTCIDMQSPQMAEVCRQRSGNSPLTVIFHGSTDRQDDTVSFTGSWSEGGDSRGKVLGLRGLKHYADLSERVDTLKIHAYGEAMVKVAEVLHSYRFPSLRILKLHSEVDAIRHLEDPINVAPCFSSLVPIFFPSNLDNPFSTGIERLDLCSLPGAIIPTIHVLANVLRACPSLLSLRLVQTTPPAMDFPKNFEPVPLVRLQKLEVRHHWAAVQSTLQLIECPVLEELNIITEAVRREPDSEFTVPDLQVLSQIRQSKHREITVVGYQVSTQSQSPFKHSITIERSMGYTSRSYFTSAITQLGAIVGGAECTHLEINNQRTIGSNFDYTPSDTSPDHRFSSTAGGWQAVYNMFPNVEGLQLSQLDTYLATAIKELEDKLPRLSSLQIEGEATSVGGVQLKDRCGLETRVLAI